MNSVSFEQDGTDVNSKMQDTGTMNPMDRETNMKFSSLARQGSVWQEENFALQRTANQLQRWIAVLESGSNMKMRAIVLMADDSLGSLPRRRG